MKNLENHVALAAEQSRETGSSTTAHTPGPWRVAPAKDYPHSIVIDIDAGERGLDGYVCSVGQRGDAQAEADARLIAAAPDLLAALQAMIAYDSATDSLERFADIIKQADTAIAKATGAA